MTSRIYPGYTPDYLPFRVVRRLLLLIAVHALVLTACGPPAEEVTATTAQGATVPSSSPDDPGTTTGSEAFPSTSAPVTTETTSGRELAPDFTLDLGEGGSYTLSKGASPVYLVFWAEW